jgi:hypothetical protein
LDVQTSDATETAIDIDNTGGGDPLIHFQVSGVAKHTIGVDNSDLDKLKFGTIDAATGTAMTIDASQNVGIGNTSPTAKLDVDGSAIFNESGAAVDFRVEGDTEANLLFVDASTDRVGIGTTTPGARLEVYENVASSVSLRIFNPFDSDPGHDVYTEYGVKSTGANPDFAWSTGIDASDDEKFKFSYATGGWAVPGTGDVMTLTGDGKVGIGTTVPDEKLDIYNSSVKFSNSNSYGVDNRMYSHWEDGSNDHQIGLEFDYYTGSGGAGTTHSSIKFISNATLNTAINGTGKVTMMSVLSNGRVGIGTTAPGYTLDVSGDINYSGSLSNVSDERYKKDINKIDNALGLIAQFDGYNYKFRKDEFPELKFDTTAQIGFIAQEIQKALPQLVSENDSGYLSVNYIKVVPILLMGMKEQQAIIEAQKAENESQKQEIETIKAEASSSSVETNQKLKETTKKLAALEAKLNALLLLNSKGTVVTAEN